MPRQLKKPVFKGIKGLGCVTQVSNIRQGQLFGDKVGIYEITDLASTIEIRNEMEQNLAELIFSQRTNTADWG